MAILLADVKRRAVSWLSATDTSFDILIDDLIIESEAHINSLINYKYVPTEQIYKSVEVIEPDNKVYVDKLPVTRIEQITNSNDDVIDSSDYELEKISGTILFKCFEEVECKKLKNNVTIEYVVGGIAEDYPREIDSIILELTLQRLNHTINNAQGFKNKKIGSDISLDFDFKLTPFQEDIIAKYTQ